jgi:glycosyltransferase involved in cell wall biosynthesis
MPTPALSVVMPVYNAQQYLAEAVESILAQTFADFEFLIVDDGSKDRSLEMLREYEKSDARVKVISRPNTGVAGALNDGLAQATAPLVARMDADDASLPERFAKQIAYLNAHPECVCVGSRVKVIDPLGSPIHDSMHKLTHEEIDRELMSGSGWGMVHPTVMMRRNAVNRVGNYRLKYECSEDLDLFLRLAEAGKITNLPDVLHRYRHHLSSANFTRYQTQWNIKKSIVADAHERRGMKMPDNWTFNKKVPLPLSEQLRNWAWAAIRAGNIDVARKHASAAFKKSPLSPSSWKVMYSAMRGH